MAISPRILRGDKFALSFPLNTLPACVTYRLMCWFEQLDETSRSNVLCHCRAECLSRLFVLLLIIAGSAVVIINMIANHYISKDLTNWFGNQIGFVVVRKVHTRSPFEAMKICRQDDSTTTSYDSANDMSGGM